eukprot:TRINITY_DN1555_c0_g1_i5.p1 TRINITY_DN1555_c0_g1~~TRINITY_DN1555_c0_g1_i5.p1  ORF type:complete len:162 (+),score=5.07 TRINITY_DN1555_c0_g1_i5:141-626(+)
MRFSTLVFLVYLTIASTSSAVNPNINNGASQIPNRPTLTIEFLCGILGIIGMLTLLIYCTTQQQIQPPTTPYRHPVYENRHFKQYYRMVGFSYDEYLRGGLPHFFYKNEVLYQPMAAPQPPKESTIEKIVLPSGAAPSDIRRSVKWVDLSHIPVMRYVLSL